MKYVLDSCVAFNAAVGVVIQFPIVTKLCSTEPPWYNHAMAIHVSDQQLDQMENGRTAAVIVRSESRKKGYALIPEHVYARLRPLLQFVAIDLESPLAAKANGAVPAWTPEKNARRVA